MPAVSLTGERPAVGARPGQSGGPQGGAPRGGSGGAAAAAIYAQLLVTSAGFGWSQGRQARIEREGNPQFVHTDPITGRETTIDLSELADLTPAEAKAYIAYFAAHGFPPPTITDTIEPHPYLDANGQWRMSDTNEPVHNVDRESDTGPVPLQNPDHYYDSQGNLRWKDTNQLVSDVPVRPQYRDRGGIWRWADTQEPVDGPDEMTSTLLEELAALGTKHDPDSIVGIGRDRSGKIVFLEEGNGRAGLVHIVNRHAGDFARRGIENGQIPDLVLVAVMSGRIVDMQRPEGSGRPIYEVDYEGTLHRVAVTVSENGFIVGANPA